VHVFISELMHCQRMKQQTKTSCALVIFSFLPHLILTDALITPTKPYIYRLTSNFQCHQYRNSIQPFRPIPPLALLPNKSISENDINQSLHCIDNATEEQQQSPLESDESLWRHTDSDIDSHHDTQNTGKAILSLAIPALAGLAIDPLMTLADTAFVGKTATNADALAGVGSAAALLTFSFYLFNFLCTVTTPLVSQRRASGDDRGAVEIGGQALSLAVLLGIVLSSVLIGFSQPLLEIMGTDNTGANANAYAMAFLTIRAVAAPAVFLISASTGILRGYLDTKSAFVILFGANVVNFLLDVVLILGMDMGPKGAAIATTTAEWIAAISFLLILAGKAPSVDGMLGSNQRYQRKDASSIIVDELREPLIQGQEEQLQLLDDGSNGQQLQLDKQESNISGMTIIIPTLDVPRWESIQPLFIASSSAFVRSFMLQLSIAGAAAMAARSGGDTVSEAASASIAAHQIALQLWLLCSFVCDALAAASQALVADGIGREDSDSIRSISRTIFMYSLGLGIFLATALGIGDASGFLLNFFTEDVPTQNALRPLLSILIAAQPLNAFVFAADGVLQGASAFTFQAKSMVLSASVAIGSFFGLQYLHQGVGEAAAHSSDTLIHVWYALIILQIMRGLTSLWKLAQPQGPIDLFANGNSISMVENNDNEGI
jgi:Na+-driven multidrug efflux pump